MTEKIKLMFDATILANALCKDSGRSGIFFTAYQIAKSIQKRKDVEMIFYCDRGIMSRLRCAIKKELNQFKQIPIWNGYGNWLQEQQDFFKTIKSMAKRRGHFVVAFFAHYLRFVFDMLCFVVNKKKYRLPNINVFFSPCFRIPSILEQNINIKFYTLLHDTIFMSRDNGLLGWCGELMDYIKHSKEDSFFANSICTKNDFLKFVSELKPEQITVTPLAAGDNFYPTHREETIKSLKKYNLPTDKRYIFSLCSLEPRKNLIRAVKTFVQFVEKNKIDDLVFILGGGHWKEFIGKLDAELGKIPEGLVIKAGYIDDEDLAPLYSGAEWFVYTSQYEGFGLPPLEAMQCGCPVITSNNSSLPEVVGDAGIMIDWDSDEQHIKAYEDYYFNPELREQMRQKGLERAKQFSWDKTVDLMINKFRKDMKK